MKRLLFITLITLFLHAVSAYADTSEAPADNSDTTQAVTAVPVDGATPVPQSSPEQLADPSGNSDASAAKNTFITRWLNMLGAGPADSSNDRNILRHAGAVPRDIIGAFTSIGDDGYAGFFGTLLRVVVAIGIGFLILFGMNKILHSRLEPLKTFSPPDDEAANVWSLSLIRNLPSLAEIFILAVASILVFLVLAGNVGPKGRMLFQAVLGTVIIFRIATFVAKTLFSPEDGSCRPIVLAEPLAVRVYTAAYLSLSILFTVLLWVRLVGGLGIAPQTYSWVILTLGSSVIACYCFLILYLKAPVAQALLEESAQRQERWLKRQLSAYWHIPALSYLGLILLIWVGQCLDGTVKQSGQFIISMLIVPIYFALRQMGRHVIVAVVDSLGLGRIDETDKENDLEALEKEAAEKKQLIISKSESVFNLIVFATLVVWLLSLWGYEIPFAATAISALFQSLVVLALALICWKSASAYIEKKMEEAAPERDDKEEEDDEFGGAVQAGRLHTLLPMLRKVVASVLVVMVVLITISSLGVNIGPLLAGAGVIGLAVGFGAQKLVSDILSGFFYLLDDAFRVGEYIEAGSNRGSVEAITLRNVMLRHSQGMLQIVPHSELGAITNYMRGGIVVKFPLEFPYDTNIDQVRKVIKKVGIAMLDDPELGEDFIRPVKSQGVNEITNSVMVIRVKFTAKPGKQFVIKREAFRRITEALNAKGIYYAHRKVIVDFPNGQSPENIDEASKQKLVEAAAAASVAAEGQNDKGGQPA